MRVGTAEAAAARYRWPLHVIEDVADDPGFEQPRRGSAAHVLKDAVTSFERPSIPT
ncbi:MAG: hypothetical protein M3O70_04295 [Actinomycetota bacterium]|nr:hypothetical protein [Actinomycetota bacterium]